ncbi:MAG: L,D-transpeptidase [Thermoleophilia bacterium]|nr:L,D-transpeptidase [Thermoleophilia bacterium]
MLPARRIAISAAACAALLVGLPAAGQASDPEVEQLDRGIHLSSLPNKSVPGPSRMGGTYTARPLTGTAVRLGPGGSATVWYARTRTKWTGSGQRLMVLGSRRVRGQTWLKVRLPVRPNSTSGWIPRDRVQLSHTNRFILVDTSRRLLRVYSKGRVVVRHKVVVGAPSTPTPTGLFALHDRVKQADPNGFVGTHTVTLTAHSNKLLRYDGGPGLVAFHGRAGASLRDPLGSARSHGCVRMNNPRIARLSQFMMGTAVKIQR